MGEAGRPRGRGSAGPRSGEVAALERRLEEQAAVIEGLKARVAELEAAQRAMERCQQELEEVRGRYEREEPTKMADLIGCLDDCVSDPEELRERCACVRRKEDRP